MPNYQLLRSSLEVTKQKKQAQPVQQEEASEDAKTASDGGSALPMALVAFGGLVARLSPIIVVSIDYASFGVN